MALADAFEQLLRSEIARLCGSRPTPQRAQTEPALPSWAELSASVRAASAYRAAAAANEQQHVGVDDCFRVLQLEPTCSPADVARAFRVRARVAHPDTPSGSHDAFIALGRARDRALQLVG